MKLSSEDIERFWSHVDKRGENECWRWAGAITSRGYGSFGSKGKGTTAHRIAWQIANGREPRKGFEIAHAPIICHDPLCCNPAHLSEKTHTENMADLKLDGTVPCGKRNGSYKHPECRARGERIANSKLTAPEVAKIREMRKQGIRGRIIAEIFKTTRQNVYYIEHCINWKHTLPEQKEH